MNMYSYGYDVIGIEGILSGGRSRLLPKAGNRAVHWNLSGTRHKDQNLSKRCELHSPNASK